MLSDCMSITCLLIDTWLLDSVVIQESLLEGIKQHIALRLLPLSCLTQSFCVLMGWMDVTTISNWYGINLFSSFPGQ